MKPKLPDTFAEGNLRDLAETLKIDTLAGRKGLVVALENIVLLDAKQQDYGPGNITAYGLMGVIMRMNDKFNRINNLFRGGRRHRALNEPLRDSLRDISNYTIIALLLDSNQWPDYEPSRTIQRS